MRLSTLAFRVIATAAVASAFVAAALQLPPPAPSVHAAQPATVSAQSVSSDIVNFVLEDLSITVGATVSWTNRDAVQHTSTSGQQGVFDGVGWNSDLLSQGQSFSHKFNQAGVFLYTCTVHPFMNATVTVVEPQPTRTPTRVPTRTPTPGPTNTPAPTATPTETPFPSLRVIGEDRITPVPPQNGVVAVVHPTSNASVQLPEEGVTLEVPAPVLFKSFQVRMQAADPDPLPAVPNTSVLRAVRIELFDERGRPMPQVTFCCSADFSIALTEGEVQEIGGLDTVLREHLAGRLRLMALHGPDSGWTELDTSFDNDTRTFSAPVSTFSTVALMWTRLPQPPTPTPTPTATASPTPTATASPTPTATASPTPTAMATPTPSATPVPTMTATASPTPSAAPSPTQSPTPTLVPAPRVTAPNTGDTAPTSAVLLAVVGLGALLALAGWAMASSKRGR